MYEIEDYHFEESMRILKAIKYNLQNLDNKECINPTGCPSIEGAKQDLELLEGMLTDSTRKA